MRCTYIGLSAALCWSGMGAGARIAKLDSEVVGLVGNHRILADVGNHRKNSSSVSAAKLRGDDYAPLELRQAGGACGAQGGKCPNNLCCSDYGFCGDSVDHCAPLFGCQTAYGVCGWPRVAATTAAPPAPTTTSVPPPPTTTSAPPPPTTSAPPRPTTTSTTSAVVISTTIVSLPPPTTVSIPPRPSTTSQPPVVIPPSNTATIPQPTAIDGLRVTTNGMCGNNTICIGASNYGPCCSQFFWCGSSLDFCGAGCQSQFGACFGVPGQPGLPASNVTSTSIPVPTTRSTTVAPPVVISTTIVSLPPPTTSTTSAPPPPTTTSAPPPPSTTSTTSARPTSTAPTLPPGMRSSTDGKCGTGVTCIGSTYGPCCSQFGWCGDGDQFCLPIVGCQAQFGNCESG